MHSKSQQGSIGFIFSVVFAFIVFALIGGDIMGLFSLAATLGNLTGLLLFIMSNFAVWIIIGIALSIILYFWRVRK